MQEKTEIQIKVPDTATLAIFGPEERKTETTIKANEVKSRAFGYGGRILREMEFKDGYFIEFYFTDAVSAEVFKMEYGL